MIPTWIARLVQATPEINRQLAHTPAENRDQEAAVLMLFSGCLLYTSPSPRD